MTGRADVMNFVLSLLWSLYGLAAVIIDEPDVAFVVRSNGHRCFFVGVSALLMIGMIADRGNYDNIALWQIIDYVYFAYLLIVSVSDRFCVTPTPVQVH